MSASKLNFRDLTLYPGFPIRISKHHSVIITVKTNMKIDPKTLARLLAFALIALTNIGIQNTHSSLSAQGFEEPAWAEEAGALRAEWLNFKVGFGG